SEQLQDQIVFAVSRTANTINQTVVNLTWSGTATLGTDYNVSATGGTLLTNNSQLRLDPGSTGGTITVTPDDDSTGEAAEGVTLTLASGTGYTVGTPASASGSIADNDGTPSVSVAATDSTGGEQNQDPITFTVTRTVNPNTQIAVNLTWSGTATLVTDYG